MTPTRTPLLLRNLGEGDERTRSLERAFAANPKEPGLKDQLIRAHERSGKHLEADKIRFSDQLKHLAHAASRYRRREAIRHERVRRAWPEDNTEGEPGGRHRAVRAQRRLQKAHDKHRKSYFSLWDAIDDDSRDAPRRASREHGDRHDEVMHQGLTRDLFDKSPHGEQDHRHALANMAPGVERRSLPRYPGEEIYKFSPSHHGDEESTRKAFEKTLAHHGYDRTHELVHLPYDIYSLRRKNRS